MHRASRGPARRMGPASLQAPLQLRVSVPALVVLLAAVLPSEGSRGSAQIDGERRSAGLRRVGTEDPGLASRVAYQRILSSTPKGKDLRELQRIQCTGAGDCAHNERSVLEVHHKTVRINGAGASEDCTLVARTSGCPDAEALVAFKAANLDPFGALSTWTFPCGLLRANQGATAGSLCRRLAAVMCSRWAGVNCTQAKRVNGVVVNNPNSDASLWGNPALGQSIPPEMGNLAELQVLDLSMQVDNQRALGGLVGPLPSELGQLTKLSNLNLRANKFWGPVPLFLSRLRELRVLDLAQNNFTGELPGAALGALTNLQDLDTSNNLGISGSIPSELGNLVALTRVAILMHSLSGSIPATMSALTNMEWLELHNCGNVTGNVPAWLSRMQRLNNLDLSSNSLTGSIPVELGALKSLQNLQLSNNQLSGEISPALVRAMCDPLRAPQMPLVSFDVSSNEIAGNFPVGFSECTNVSSLFLQSNKLTGAFPNISFFKNEFLVSFSVANNSLHGTIPRFILSAMPRLNALSLNNNNFSGPLPFLSCPKYSLSFTLELQGNSFSGQLPPIFTHKFRSCIAAPDVAMGASPLQPANERIMQNVVLNFADNQLSGPFPTMVLATDSLVEVHLDRNLIQGDLPQVPRCPSALQYLTAAGNRLTGPIPKTLGLCTALQFLDLSSNVLTGAPPPELARIGSQMQVLKLGDNRLTGPVPAFVNFFQQLLLLNLSRNALSGTLPASIAMLPNLISLDLSGNGIQGPILDAVGSLTVLANVSLADNLLSGPVPATLAPPSLEYLTYLDLSSNRLEGPVPYGFANYTYSLVPRTSRSVFLNLANNNLSGPIPGGPDGALAQSLPAAAVGNNSLLCGGAGLPDCPSASSSSLSTGAIVGIAVGTAAGVLLILGAVYWFLRRRDEWAGGTMLVFEKLDFPLAVEQILEATEKFDDKYRLGRGGFGTVYRATLQDGRTVAIKRLGVQSSQGDREFQAEMQTLGNVRHRNLVVLVAAYIAPPSSGERLLIYNFLSGGSLDNVLSSLTMPKDSPYRHWEVRRNIALDVARGLKYLHHDCTPRIIHRDMKPANVLMDDQLVAHVADFGLAREVEASKSHMSTAVFGTIGYLAPEYTQRGRLTFKSDVFAYGVLLLQLITGKQPTDEDVAERGLARWVGASSTASVVDPRMEMGPYMNQILGAIKLGLLCTARVPADRPSMQEVVHLLENLDDFAKGITMEPEDAAEADSSTTDTSGTGHSQ